MRSAHAAGLLVAAVVLGDPSAPPPPRNPPPPGRTGWLSDATREVHVRFEGTRSTADGGDVADEAAVLEHVRRAAEVLARSGPPVPVRPDDVAIRFPSPDTWVADAGFLAADLPSADTAPAGAYRDLDRRLAVPDPDGLLGPEVRVATIPGPDRLATPPCGAFAAKGELRVIALFGQMDAEVGLPADQGTWNLRRLERHLRAGGFEPADVPDGADRRLRLDVPGGPRVVVDLVGPERLPREDPGRLAATVRGAQGRADVLYFVGHSTPEPLASLGDPQAWGPARPRIAVLDACWTLQRFTRDALAAAGPGLQVVSNPGRSYVGSVDSFAVLLDALVSCANADAPPPPWLGLLEQMNARSLQRFQDRLARNPATPRRDREQYGVSVGSETGTEMGTASDFRR